MSPAIRKALKSVPMAESFNAFFKAVVVEHDAASIRRRYSRRARELGVSAPKDGAALREVLAKRIGARTRDLGWPKPRGELHIFLCYPQINWEAILPRALATFGEVSVFEWRSAGFNEMAPDWIQRRDAMNLRLLEVFLTAHRRRPVDLVVGYISGLTASAETLKTFANHGAVVTNFCFDDKVDWPGPKRGGRFVSTAEICGAVDLNLTSDPEGPLRYAVEGCLAMFHPEAADPELHRPVAVPFEYDVSFVGARFGWRPRLMEGLKRRGIDVACFGVGWPNGPVSNEEMHRIYAKSRINLGCGGIGYSRKLLCLKGRDFEVPMSGALYLTQHNPELALVYEIGRDILTFRDVPECARQIRGLLAAPERASAIRAAARHRSLVEHTYEARWGRVLEVLGALA